MDYRSPSPAGFPDRRSSQVHHQETTQPINEVDTEACGNFGQHADDFFESHLPDLDLVEGLFRHSGWSVDRRRVWVGLQSVASRARARSFGNCGAGAYVNYSASLNRYRITGHYCHDRLCAPCNAALAAVVRSNASRYVAEHHITVRFLTLTLKHSDLPLADQITRLYQSFSTLRRREFFKQHCVGGIAFLEVKLAKDGVRWHPHLHCLIEGGYLDGKQLSQEWLKVTGDSSIIDIRRPDDTEHTISYVCKYISKPCHHDVLRSPEMLNEYAAAIKGRRRFVTWGNWRGTNFSKPPPDTTTDWKLVASLSTLLQAARAGDDKAKQILEMVAHQIKSAPVAPYETPPPETDYLDVFTPCPQGCSNGLSPTGQSAF